MHNSQDNQPMWKGAGEADTRALLVNSCIGCHTKGSDTGYPANNGSNPTPYVVYSSAPTYTNAGTSGETLAGGYFYWATTDDDHKVHNVKGIANLQTTPPGWKEGFDANGQVNTSISTSTSTQLTCAGEFGCHGTHDSGQNDLTGVSKAHHKDDISNPLDGTTVGTSYRFLKGIVGKEYNTDGNKWEYQPTYNKHNQYKGVDRTSDEADGTDDSKTISYLCAECHGKFHSGTTTGEGVDEGTFGSPWFRHPVDFDMGNVKTKADFAGYGGVGTYQYQVVAPVASADVSSIKSNVYSADDAIVTCISCHRAHGTPYYALLRWDYKNWPGGADSDGCSYCHTTKD